VRTAGNDGLKLLIFVPRAAHSHDLLSSFVGGRGQVSAETYAPGFTDSGFVAWPATAATRLRGTMVSL
jgi:hypothetical protein